MFNPVEDDNEIDRLSREAAAGYKAPGQPNWDVMQDLLDKSMPVQERKRRPLLWWLFPAALVIGGLGYWQLTATPAEQTGDPVTADLHATKSIEKRNEPVIDNVNTQKQEITVADPLASTNPAAQLPPLSKSYKRGMTAKAKKDMITVETPGDDIATTSPKTDPVQTSTTGVKADENINHETSVATGTSTEMPVINETAQPRIAVPVAEAKDSAAEKQVVTVKNKTAGKAWAIGLVGGLDETTIKFKYGYAPGYGIGMLAGYHFNKTFALYTGAVYTQKNYKMAGDDFTAPKGSWASYYKLETVEGYCRMWEVPLLARFYTRQTANKGFFLSTGISSYFMTHENYTYAYHYMGAPATRKIDYANSTTHFVSILDLSAGFESRIGNDLYMQIEPYAKFPLSGLGRGQTELSSFGINLGLQLRKPIKH